MASSKSAKTSGPSKSQSAKFQALYRKYRPTKLADVVGQEEITTALQNSVERGQISHAYLFIGPRGTGKTSVARILAHLVNDFPYKVEDDYLDIIEIDAASNTGVDNIRELREKAIIAPSKGKYKVYIIDEIHMLSRNAANALLKTLEEPPEHVIFIMATTEAHKVPITVSSRAQIHTFKLARPEVMQRHLRQIADAEGIKITDGALEVVVRRGGGSFRDSLSLLDQVAKLSDGEMTETELVRILGLPQEQAITDLLQGYTSGDATRIHHTLHDLLNTGVKPEVVAQEIITHVIAQPSPELLHLLGKLTEVSDPFPEVKLLLAFLGDSRAGNFVPPSHPTPGVKPLTTPPERSEEVMNTEKAPEDQEKIGENNAENRAKNQPENNNFSWEGFLKDIQEANGIVYAQLCHTSHEIQGNTVHLYPERGLVKSILGTANNRQLLTQHLQGMELIIHDPGTAPAPKDPQISQISDIIGGIQEINEETPF